MSKWLIWPLSNHLSELWKLRSIKVLTLIDLKTQHLSRTTPSLQTTTCLAQNGTPTNRLTMTGISSTSWPLTKTGNTWCPSPAWLSPQWSYTFSTKITQRCFSDLKMKKTSRTLWDSRQTLDGSISWTCCQLKTRTLLGNGKSLTSTMSWTRTLSSKMNEIFMTLRNVFKLQYATR